MGIKIALVGNPNCGKTTIFNELTGSSQYVGNWPGVTVQKKEGWVKGRKEIVITDLPGIYSLSPYTPEETAARKYLLDGRPDVIVNVADANNLERNLYLTTQLLETGIPVVLVLNMIDLLRKKGIRIDTKKLSIALGCPVLETAASKGDGLIQIVECAEYTANGIKRVPRHLPFDKSVERVLCHIRSVLGNRVKEEQTRFFSIRLFERDQTVTIPSPLSFIEREEIEACISSCEQELADDAEAIITSGRYEMAERIARDCISKGFTRRRTGQGIDRLVTNRILAFPIFAAVMSGIYFCSVSWIGPMLSGWIRSVFFENWIRQGCAWLLESIGAADWLSGLILDGFIGGVGAVLAFLPQMFLLFFFLSLLEDCGYMARVAFIMDRIFRQFGLSGKSFIPLLIGSGCSVPGIMASRAIENDNERRITVLTTSFIPCGAKLPVIALIGGAVFPDFPWMAPASYFCGILAVLLSGIIFKKSKRFSGDTAPFIMELPPYLLPSLKNTLLHVVERGKSFLLKAGTVIFLACGAVWLLSHLGFSPEGFGMAEERYSILATVGMLIAPLFLPLGFGSWQAAVAALSGLIAKENIVGSLGVLLGSGTASGMETLFPYAAAALSFLAFNLFCIPCIAAVGAMHKEMGSLRQTAFALFYQTVFAYLTAFLINQLGGFLSGALPFGPLTLLAFFILFFVGWLLLHRPKSTTALADPLNTNSRSHFLKRGL